jgi:hypothetical protein
MGCLLPTFFTCSSLIPLFCLVRMWLVSSFKCSRSHLLTHSLTRTIPLVLPAPLPLSLCPSVPCTALYCTSSEKKKNSQIINIKSQAKSMKVKPQAPTAKKHLISQYFAPHTAKAPPSRQARLLNSILHPIVHNPA